jgi:hypothetical protein
MKISPSCCPPETTDGLYWPADVHGETTLAETGDAGKLPLITIPAQ